MSGKSFACFANLPPVDRRMLGRRLPREEEEEKPARLSSHDCVSWCLLCRSLWVGICRRVPQLMVSSLFYLLLLSLSPGKRQVPLGLTFRARPKWMPLTA